MKRLDHVEKKLMDLSGITGEIEDLSETEAAVYGYSLDNEAGEGDGALDDLPQDHVFPAEKPGTGADSRRKYTTQEDFTHEKYQKGSF